MIGTILFWKLPLAWGCDKPGEGRWGVGNGAAAAGEAAPVSWSSCSSVLVNVSFFLGSRLSPQSVGVEGDPRFVCVF